MSNGHDRRGEPPDRSADVVVVGAGFAGLYAVHRLRGLGLDVQGYEAADGVGGVWYWNRYPGARCDTKSLEYSYSFSEELQQEWDWTEDYATQPEILRYLEHVAERFDLLRSFELGVAVASAHYAETEQRWWLGLDDGRRVSTRFCVMATGPLSVANVPDLPGLEEFGGPVLHTGHWPLEGFDVTGRRVGIIGTGSSGIQAIPVIAQDAEHLFVFQRSPNFVVPAHNKPLVPEYQRQYKRDYDKYRLKALHTPNGLPYTPGDRSALEVTGEERRAAYEDAWAEGGPKFVRVFRDILTDFEANETCAEFVREKIRQRVDDPAVAEMLSPRIPIGGKRTPADTDYFEAYNRDNVTLVDIRTSPIERILPDGLATEDGTYRFDTLILATGFDAMTGALLGIDIRGVGGESLADKWADGPRTYLGIVSAGFPNLFIVSGPQSPSVTCNMALAAEQHVDWLADLLVHLSEQGIGAVDADPASEDAWVTHVIEVADRTLFPKVDSWYTGSNIPGKPRVFTVYVGGAQVYRELCDEIARDDYRGFVMADSVDGGPHLADTGDSGRRAGAGIG